MDEIKKEYTFFWFIENYSHCWHSTGKKLVSPNFIVDKLEGTAWVLDLYPRGMNDEYKDRLSLLLRRNKQDDGPNTIYINFEIAIIGADRSDIYCMNLIYPFQKDSTYGINGFKVLEKLLLPKKADFFPQDVLTIRCKLRKGKGRFQNIGQSSARTRIIIEKNSFLHEVEQFSALQANTRQEKIIQMHSKKGCFISSHLYFTEDKITVDIVLSDTIVHSDQMFCKCEVSLLDRFGNIIECGVIDNRYDAARKDIYSIPLTLSREDILNKSEYLQNNKLSLICKCTFSSGIEFGAIEETLNEINLAFFKHKSNSDPKNNAYPVEKLYVIPSASEDIHFPRANICIPAEKLSTCPSVLEDIKYLYINQSLTDVQVKTVTKSFPAHKIILCARSPVFKTMLTNDMKEKNSNCIHINDLEDDIVQQMLLFLYSDSIENLQWENAIQLYYVADKYQIGKLREVCSSFLVENLAPTNAGDILLLADTHNDVAFQKSVEDFILKHEEQVFCSKEWDKVAETNPSLALKTMKLKYTRINELN